MSNITASKTDPAAETRERLQEIGQGAIRAIMEMVENLEHAETEDERERAMDAIYEDPLSFEVRSGWHSPGEDAEPEEFRILLSTGGPAVQIVGKVDGSDLTDPVLQVQDWFIPWTEVSLDAEQQEALEQYVIHFSL